MIAHFNGGGSSYLDYFTGGSGGALADHSARPTPACTSTSASCRCCCSPRPRSSWGGARR
ncbi:hypothetical protein [Barrientosiimonas endolithica]|uniref:hypothetical protein n=1 Tax=Barrientosiimonas endolithica TaxID=1535208 RepID=UPI00259B4B61|nr:hypothetical protein [Barrientosiimonas endolithica]